MRVKREISRKDNEMKVKQVLQKKPPAEGSLTESCSTSQHDKQLRAQFELQEILGWERTSGDTCAFKSKALNQGPCQAKA